MSSFIAIKYMYIPNEYVHREKEKTYRLCVGVCVFILFFFFVRCQATLVC